MDVLTVMGKLTAPGRGAGVGPSERLALLRRLIASSHGRWRAEDIAGPQDDLDRVRACLRDLRRCGVLVYAEELSAYTLVDGLRVPLSLVLLALAPPDGDDQVGQLHALIPFAQLRTRADERQAPAWAMVDALAARVRALRGALDEGVHALDGASLRQAAGELSAAARQLAQVQDSYGEALSLRAVVERTVAEASELAEQIVRASRALTSEGRQHLRVPTTQVSVRQLRAALVQVDDATLAGLVRPVGQPQLLALPSERVLADAAHDAAGEAARPTVELATLRVAHAPDDGPPLPDSRDLAQEALASGRSRAMALFGPMDTWAQALRLQQGLVRVQSELVLVGRGGEGWQASEELVEYADGHPVARSSEIERRVVAVAG